jgi:hypothetical protein
MFVRAMTSALQLLTCRFRGKHKRSSVAVADNLYAFGGKAATDYYTLTIRSNSKGLTFKARARRRKELGGFSALRLKTMAPLTCAQQLQCPCAVWAGSGGASALDTQ